MAKKSIALGSIVEGDFLGTDPTTASAFVTLGLTTGFSPPGRPGTEADGKDLATTLDTPLPGIEGPAEFNWVEFYEPGDAEDIAIQAAFNDRRKPAGAGGGVITIRVVYPHNGTAPTDVAPTQIFQVNILAIGPEEVSEPNSTFKRAVQCRRISDIFASTFTFP